VVERAALGLLMLYAFAVPWEYSLDLGEPLGNVARICGLLLLLAMVPLVLRRDELRRPGAVQWLVMGLLLFFVLSGLWTVDVDTTVDKMRSYFQVMMVVWIGWELVRSPNHLRWLMLSVVAGCWVLAVLTMMEFTSAEAVAAEQIRFAAEGQDPNDVARFLDLGFPLAAWLLATEKTWWCRWLAAGYVPVGFTAVLLTASRGGFSGALVALAGTTVLLVRWRPKAAMAVLAGIAGLGVATWGLVPADTLDRLGTIPEQIGSGDLNDRLSLWIAGFRAFRQAPWLGYGAGNFSLAAGLSPGDTAHNTGMAILVTGGLAGAGIFLGLLMALGSAVWRMGGLLQVAMGTLLAVWLTTAMVGSVEENRTTWLVFTIMALAGEMDGGSREPSMAEYRRL
jgi:O-antigen ligase